MSQFTAIKRTKPSAPMKWLHANGLLLGRVLDFGCGRGFDANSFSLEAYDPYWRPDMPAGKFNTITCVYVLNVLTPTQGSEVIQSIKEKLLPNGKAYFAVRRDLKRARKGRGCIQRLVSLQMPSVRSVSNYEIYEYTNLPL